MSDPATVERLDDIAERAKCLVLSRVQPTTRGQHYFHQNKFTSFCVKNALYDPSEVTDEAPNHMAYCITTRFEEGSKAGTFDNIRSVIWLHNKRLIKLSNGRAIRNHLNKHTGNPYGAIDAAELIKVICNTARNRGDVSKRSTPIMMSVECQLQEFIKIYIETNPNLADVGFRMMAGCSACFACGFARESYLGYDL